MNVTKWGDGRTRSIVWHSDPDLDIRKLVGANLERANYQYIPFAGAADLMDALRDPLKAKPDLVILETCSDHGEGDTPYEVISFLKSDPDTAEHIGIIILSRMFQDAEVFRGWQSGVDQYLTKPFNPMDILNFTRKVLDEKLGRGAALLR